MKKSLAVLLVFVMLFALTATGCGSDEPSKVNGEESTYKLNFSVTSKPEYCINRAMRDMEAYVEEESEGRIQIEIFDNGSLGSDRETCEAVAMGDQEMIACSPYTLNQVTSIPEWLFWDTPYTIDDKEVLYKFFEGEAVAGLLEKTAESGIKVLGLGENGPLCVNTVSQVKSPADIAKLKLRAAEIRTTVDFFNAMGTQTSVVSYSELYTAMQQGLMDGSSTTVSLVHDSGTWDFAKYVTETRTGFNAIAACINTSLYESMSDNDKAIMDAAGEVFSKALREYSDAEYETSVADMEAGGVTVHKLTNEEKSEFIPYAETVYDEWSVKMGEFWVKAMADLEAIGYDCPAKSWPK